MRRRRLGVLDQVLGLGQRPEVNEIYDRHKSEDLEFHGNFPPVGPMPDRVQSIWFTVSKEKEMTLHGRVRNGFVVLDDSGVLPDGTEVTVHPVLTGANPRKRPKRPAKGNR